MELPQNFRKQQPNSAPQFAVGPLLLQSGSCIPQCFLNKACASSDVFCLIQRAWPRLTPCLLVLVNWYGRPIFFISPTGSSCLLAANSPYKWPIIYSLFWKKTELYLHSLDSVSEFIRLPFLRILSRNFLLRVLCKFRTSMRNWGLFLPQLFNESWQPEDEPTFNNSMAKIYLTAVGYCSKILSCCSLEDW